QSGWQTSGASFTPPSRQAGDGARIVGEFQDMQAGIGAIDDVDITAIVGLDIVGLDRDLAAVPTFDADAALVGRRRDRGNEIADFPGMIGISDVERADTGIEESDE